MLNHSCFSTQVLWKILSHCQIQHWVVNYIFLLHISSIRFHLHCVILAKQNQKLWIQLRKSLAWQDSASLLSGLNEITGKQCSHIYSSSTKEKNPSLFLFLPRNMDFYFCQRFGGWSWGIVSLASFIFPSTPLLLAWKKNLLGSNSLERANNMLESYPDSFLLSLQFQSTGMLTEVPWYDSKRAGT